MQDSPPHTRRMREAQEQEWLDWASTPRVKLIDLLMVTPLTLRKKE